MAKAQKLAKEETPVEVPQETVDNGLVEVEYAVGEFNATINFADFRVDFVDGKASVLPEIAKKLKEEKLIK
jgi:hypothetical protein